MLSPDRLSSLQAAQLLTPQICDRCWVIHLRDVFEISGDKSIHQPERTEHVWLLEKAHNAFADHKQRVVATNVIGSAILDQGGPKAVG